MMLFHFNQHRSKLLLGFVIGTVVVFGRDVYAEDGIHYFNQPEMDYWKKPGSGTQAKASLSTAPQSKSTQASESSFQWKKYLDPKNDEFFKEGEYLPPAPFMEIARDPSDENINHWFKYLEAKNQVTRRLQAKLTEYAAKHSQDSLPLNELPSVPVHLPEPVALSPDARRFRLRLYFDSKCPHCERMMGTLKALSLRGYSVELKQVDADVQARNRIPFPVSGATPSELKQYKIESVPVLLVGDLKARSYFTIQGYQSEVSVLKVLTDLASKQEGVSL